MQRLAYILLFVLIHQTAFPWGATGHRVTGEIAEMYLSRKAKKNLKKLFGQENLAVASTWMDEIKSAPGTRHLSPWHYVSIPDSLDYERSEKNPDGDVIWAIETIIDSIKGNVLPDSVERDLVRMLVHLIGDIHQPLHVGRAEDKGGNSVRVKWFGKASNLHRVWDSDMIEGHKMSYTELASNLYRPTKSEIRAWQNSGPRDWSVEAMALREGVYNYPGENLGYKYAYRHFDTVKERLLLAGVRIAGVLNELYG
ncbi:MAG: S1/P1 nuclease [Cryomorphaceae bacterium]|nr:S1/P1 nuclease [Cryomorphaceae bacterium]